MKVIFTLALAVAQIADFAPAGTVPGKLRFSIVESDGTTVLATQDVDDTAAGALDSAGAVEVSFAAVADGAYTAVAQRLTADAVPANLGAPSTTPFTVVTPPAGGGGTTPPAATTFQAPAGLTVAVVADDVAQTAS